MKTLINIINEKLKINSKSKVSSLTKDIAKYLGISETDAEVIETKYLHKEYFDLDKIYKKDLLASEFELVFLLAAMLVDDNAKVDDIERLVVDSESFLLEEDLAAVHDLDSDGCEEHQRRC